MSEEKRLYRCKNCKGVANASVRRYCSASLQLPEECVWELIFPSSGFALGGPASTPSDVEGGWVIEGAWSPPIAPEYWLGSSVWSSDHLGALRFARQIDAQRAADAMLAGMNIRICYHEWDIRECVLMENIRDRVSGARPEMLALVTHIASNPKDYGQDAAAVARALLAASPSPWRSMESAPKDGATIEVRGVMLVHYVQGAKFPTMPADWRPDTPQTRWHPTEWRLPEPTSEGVASVPASEASHKPLPSPPSEGELAQPITASRSPATERSAT